MNAVHEALEDELEQTVLKQGERPKRELLDAFRADEHSVLFATSSFWEGVDVEGDALKLVIIDKLPFASPSDPLIRARMDSVGGPRRQLLHGLLGALGGADAQAGLRAPDPLPHEDTGVVAILDSRIHRRRYGKYFSGDAAPGAARQARAGVKRWWRERFGAPEQRSLDATRPIVSTHRSHELSPASMTEGHF